MMKLVHRQIGVSGVLLFLGIASTAVVARDTVAKASAPKPFAEAKVQFEQNATDGDYEVVFEVMGGEEGLSKLTIVAPNGRTLVDFSAPDASALGLRQFRFESPEPKDLRSLQAVYPEGDYILSGTSASGATLQGRATLKHPLPPSASFVRPAAGATGVATRGTVISWKAVPGVAAYVVYVEQEELGVNINARLSGSATSFAVPDGFLLPGTEYVMGLGTVMKSGNMSVVEASFTTARN